MTASYNAPQSAIGLANDTMHLSTIGVVGAGVIGAGLAEALAQAGPADAAP